MIAIYAITDVPPASLPEGQQLTAVDGAGLVAVCGPAEERPITADLLWRHEDVVETLMKTCDLLPVRFGMRVQDESAAAAVLDKQRSELVAALDRVRGAVELSVRVAGEGEPAGMPGRGASGADYIREKARRAACEESLAARIHEPLSRLARSSRRWDNLTSNEPFRAAYLVERDGITRFAKRVGSLQQENPDVRILCTGPWPPYSFVDR